MKDEGYHKSKPPKSQKYVIYPFGKANKLTPKNVPGSLTPGKDTGGSSQRPILPGYYKKPAGTMSKEFNKGPIKMGTGRWKSGTKTFGKGK